MCFVKTRVFACAVFAFCALVPVVALAKPAEESQESKRKGRAHVQRGANEAEPNQLPFNRRGSADNQNPQPLSGDALKRAASQFQAPPTAVQGKKLDKVAPPQQLILPGSKFQKDSETPKRAAKAYPLRTTPQAKGLDKAAVPKRLQAPDLKLSKDAIERLPEKYRPQARAKAAGKSEFVKEKFPAQYKNFRKGSQDQQVSRYFRLDAEQMAALERHNSFVKKHDIDRKRHDHHWTHWHNPWHAAHHHANWKWHAHWNPNWGYRHFAWYPWFGWGGLGSWGYGFVWPAWTVGYYAVPYYGYNYYYAGAAPVYAAAYQAAAAAPPEPAGPTPAAPAEPANPTPAAPPEQAAADEEVTEQDRASAAAFAEQGEIDFKAANYHAAAKDWQHSLVDDPRNGAIMMLLAQALFAEGKYEQAAGATQAAMQMLPEDKWGVVIANYAELYGNVQDYTDQLRALEAARKANPDSPALRFLLGFHFGYLNYPKQAVSELDKALSLAPRDLGSRKVREIFAARWPEAPPLPKAVLEAEAAQPATSGPVLPTPAEPGPSDAGAEDKVAAPPDN